MSRPTNGLESRSAGGTLSINRLFRQGMFSWSRRFIGLGHRMRELGNWRDEVRTSLGREGRRGAEKPENIKCFSQNLQVRGN
jgi:hypothetical protein